MSNEANPSPQNSDFTTCRDCNATWSGCGGLCPICESEGQPETMGDERPASAESWLWEWDPQAKVFSIVGMFAKGSHLWSPAVMAQEYNALESKLRQAEQQRDQLREAISATRGFLRLLLADDNPLEREWIETRGGAVLAALTSSKEPSP